MDIASRPAPVSTPSRRLAAEVARCLRGARRMGTCRVVRIEVPVDACDPLEWLHVQEAGFKVYWHGRESTSAHAGIGRADHALGDPEATLAELERRLPDLPPGARYYGGLRFGPDAMVDPEWEAFGSARFVLPRVELRVTEDRAMLAANLVLPRDARHPERVLAELDAVRWPSLARATDLPLPTAREDAPGRAAWSRSIADAIEAFETTPLDKVVLARRATFAFADALDPFHLLQRLETATPSCFHFLIQPQPGVAFVGASPERLFWQERRALESEAVAGTRPRGASASSDDELRRELMLSDKDRREHEYVRAHLAETLEPLTTALDADAEPSDMPLARGRHLYSGVRATLADGVSSLDVLRALHPTPAVGGTPTPEALRMIEATEPFDRGWYAGPVGWIGADAAEFAVAIRSGLVWQHDEGATLALYSGAGIVTGSEADAEWAEIEHKISNFARVLGLDA